jgi:hypothetical protein
LAERGQNGFRSHPVVAWFKRGQVADIEGERTVINGLEVNGVGGPGGLINLYNFCPASGSMPFWTFDQIPDSFPACLPRDSRTSS